MICAESTPDCWGPMTDLELMRALQAGDPDSMGVLVERFGRRIFKYLLGWIKNREDALDLTQEVLLRVHQKAALYSGEAPLGPWIFRIARNLFHDHMRKKNYKVHSAASDLDDALRYSEAPARQTPERAVFGAEISLRIHEAIEKLPTRQREVVQLRLLGEMKLDDIAQAMNLSLGGVKSTLHAALNRLRQELSDLERGAHV